MTDRDIERGAFQGASLLHELFNDMATLAVLVLANEMASYQEAAAAKAILGRLNKLGETADSPSDVAPHGPSILQSVTTHDRFLTPAEAAEILGVSKYTVRRYIRQGKLPARRLASGHYLKIERRDVEAMVAGGAS